MLSDSSSISTYYSELCFSESVESSGVGLCLKGSSSPPYYLNNNVVPITPSIEEVASISSPNIESSVSTQYEWCSYLCESPPKTPSIRVSYILDRKCFTIVPF